MSNRPIDAAIALKQSGDRPSIFSSLPSLHTSEIPAESSSPGRLTRFWLGLQMDCDLDVTEDELGERLKGEVTFFANQ
ncbi:hypothetical protein [Synechococcus sp. PCC 7336]|uniref:hypothetical protein n=1 Tax=Synechococcus sp. PCC 7336 TaxID=195250 RepID=UPI0003462D8A|nr:hypothetical protein [Synechococcus sp. PCC 7336]